MEELGWNKVLFSSQHGQNTNGQTATAGFPVLFTPERQISGLMPISSFIKNQNDSDFILSPHLVRFVMCFFGYSCFRSVGSWIVGLAIGRTDSRGINVTINFFR